MMKRNLHLLKILSAIPTGLGIILFSMTSTANGGALPADTVSTMLTTSAIPVSVQPETSLIVNESEVRAGLLYDVENKKIIWQKNLNSAYPIASLTKMMVALLAVEDVRKGIFTWEDQVKWSRLEYRGRGKSRKKITTQVTYTLRDVFKAAMIASNNECSEQMARFLGNGDLAATINRMNVRARELQMQSTFYGNPTGLPASKWMNDNSSTPADQLMLTLEMLKYDEILEIAGMGYASIENGKASSVIRNHNRLTIDYSGEVDGLKTGYTRRAGFCLVATTAKCDHRIVGIVFGCRGPQIRNDVIRDMFNDYYSSIGLDKLGPYCEAPMAQKQPALNGTKGEMVTVKESVKKVHQVRSGETLSEIATRYRCSVTDLKKWNSKTVRSSRIVAGQRLTVYTRVSKKVFIEKPANGTEMEDDSSLAVTSTNSEVKAVPEKKVSSPIAQKSSVQPKKQVVVSGNNYFYHTVAPGDTLTSIARKYEGTTVEQLKTMNRITDARSLKPGMKLKVLVQS
ncbi:MAG: LysM peptidoglycan-binding domain-containing protein [Bacteroidia bacterium]|nr:LysM peptidoglycan-binding domain-containing protein [Bacteroidia bacterium]